MSVAPQVAMRNASQIWQIFFPSQTLQVFCFSFAKPSNFLFGPLQKGTICSSECEAQPVIVVQFVPLQLHMQDNMVNIRGMELIFKQTYANINNLLTIMAPREL
jgi:hypothetical protein